MTEQDEGRALQKYLQDRGFGSRRQVQEMIMEGQATVNGAVITRFAEPVYPGDVVRVGGEGAGEVASPIVLLMHKPKKHVTKLEDPEGKPSLGRYLAEGLPYVFPVGRLDYNSEGALLFTNDGLLARRVLHPDFELPKWYGVKVRGHLTGQEPWLDAMRGGMTVGRRRYKPAQVEVGVLRSRATWLHITISEGKNRQIRRMCAACGIQIVKLRRLAVGPVALGDLNPRVVRPVEGRERDALYRAVGMTPP